MDTEVSEVTALVPAKPFEMHAYLDAVANDRAIEQQQQLVIAYDRAVRALVGPNDVQRDGGREFKKKSAWRKLARYFGISTAIVREETHTDAEGHLVSTVIVRASAPWGQFAEAIAKCSTRERRFGKDRSKADHDCPATAQTRATNRAVSDLIAAGEVSAEEMEFGEVAPARVPESMGHRSGKGDLPQPREAPRQQVGVVPDRGLGDKLMPFGKEKGKRLADITTDNLIRTVDWCGKTDEENALEGKEKKFESLIAACLQVIESRK